MHLGRYKVMPNATAAANLGRAIAQAYAAQISKPWPMPPDSYGPGRQPEPKEDFYQRWYVLPIQHLIPAPPEAIALGGGPMNGHVLFEDLSQADKDIIEPPGLQVGASESTKLSPESPVEPSPR